MVYIKTDETFGPVFRWFAVASGMWFIVVGPVLAIFLGLSFAAELLLVVLPAAALGAIGAYIGRPDKFRASGPEKSLCQNRVTIRRKSFAEMEG